MPLMRTSPLWGSMSMLSCVRTGTCAPGLISQPRARARKRAAGRPVQTRGAHRAQGGGVGKGGGEEGPVAEVAAGHGLRRARRLRLGEQAPDGHQGPGDQVRRHGCGSEDAGMRGWGWREGGGGRGGAAAAGAEGQARGNNEGGRFWKGGGGCRRPSLESKLNLRTRGGALPPRHPGWRRWVGPHWQRCYLIFSGSLNYNEMCNCRPTFHYACNERSQFPSFR